MLMPDDDPVRDLKAEECMFGICALVERLSQISGVDFGDRDAELELRIADRVVFSMGFGSGRGGSN